MIDPKELRIGNWFIGGWDGTSYLQVNAGYLASWTGEGYGSFPEPNPIILTTELLEKCGFEWEDIDQGNKIVKGQFKDILMMLQSPNKIGIYAAPYGYPMSPHRTRYLHQVQNLYFALTGKELEIKL